MSNNNLIHTLSLWAEFNNTVKEGYSACGLTSPIQPVSAPCDSATECEECFFKIDHETQDKTIESLDRYTGWKL